MLEQCELIGFVPVTDAVRARAFYVDVLGLEFVSDEPFALVVRAHGRMLRLVKMETVNPAAFTVLGWEVAAIGEMAQGLAGRGVVFLRYPWFEQDELGIWSAPGGAKVAWFKDPDGNVLSLSQDA